MNKECRKRLLLIFSTMGIATSVHAAMPIPYGWYVQGNLGRSYITNTDLPGKLKYTGLGWSATLGYKFTPYLSGDLDYTSYAKVRLYNAAGVRIATTSYFSYDLAGKLILPIGTSGAEVFGKLGIGRVHTYTSRENIPAANFAGISLNTGTRTRNAFIYGTGVDYAVTHNILIDIQWMRAQTYCTLGRSDLLSGGITYII